jgi:RHS repeat-associated protein
MQPNAAAVLPVRSSAREVKFYFIVPLLLSCSIPVYGQLQTGQPASAANSTPIPGSGHDYIHLLSETVDPASGSVNLHIDFGAPKGRGIILPATYNYASSNLYSITQDAITQVIQFEQPGLIGQNDFSAAGSFPVATWSESAYQIPPTTEGTGGTQITYPYCNYANSFTFKDSAGASHNLNLSVTATAVNGPQGTQNNCGNGATASGTDGQVTAAFASPATTVSTVGSWVPSNQTDPAVNGAVGPFTVTDAAGTTYFFGGTAESVTSEHVWEATANKIEDRNGNVIAPGNCPTAAAYCDTLSRPVFSSSGNSITVAGVSYTLSNGSAGMSTINYTVSETGGSVNSGGNTVACPTTNWSVSASGTGSVAREQSIALPNGTSYTLYFGDYNASDSTVTNPYGLINEIIYPDGGWVKYSWVMSPQYAQVGSFAGKYLQGPLTGQPYPSGCVYEYSTPVVSVRQVSYDGVHVAQKQTYGYTTTWSSSDDWTNKTTTVTATDEATGESAQITYSYLPSGNNIPLEQTVARYDWGNTTTPLDTETKAWFTNSTNQEQLACDFHTTNAGKSTGHFYQYAYAQISDDKEYDFGQIASPAAVCVGTNPSAPTSPTPVRETLTQFQAFTNPLGAVFGKPSSVTVYGNGAKLSQTTYAYDQTSVVSASATSHDETGFGPSVQGQRGNATTITTGGSATTYTYDETGQITSVTEPCGNTSCSDMGGGSHKTTYSYSDSPSGGNSGGSSNAYLTSITYPQVNGITAQKSFAFNYSTGELASAADENGHTTTFNYGDSLKRLTEVLGPPDPNNASDQSETTYCYQDSASSGCASDSLAPPNVVTSQYLSASNVKTSISARDGMGHVVETEIVSDTSGADIVNISYNGEGQIASQSNPHRLTSSTSDGTTLYTYDALSRKTIQTQPDQSSLQWCYNGVPSKGQGNCAANASSKLNADWVDYADETGRDTQQVTDGLGRLVAAMEPNPASGSRLETDYQYDALNHLTQVDQWGGAALSAGDRQRKFSYDSLSRLVTAANTETGTITYAYDANGNLASKTDARGNGVWYCYDVLNRVTGKAYTSQTCSTAITSPVATYAYDTSSVSGALNDIGKLTSATAYNGSTIVAQTIPYDYDVMGRLVKEEQCTPANCSTAPYSLLYSFDLAGDLTSATNGASNDGIAEQYSYDSVGRLITIAAVTTWEDNNHPSTLLSGTNYGPVGLLSANLAIDNETAQPGLTVGRSYDSRLRINTESDQGSNIVFAAGGATTLTIGGAVQSKGSTPAVGSVTINGSEQSQQTAAATNSSGSIAISGSEQQTTSVGTSGTGQISISGSERTTTFYVPCGSQQCPVTAYDSGQITAVVNGTSYTVPWGSGYTPTTIATQLASVINAGSLATANATGSAVSITAKTTGTASNYSLSVSSTDLATQYFSGVSFSATDSGSTLTGGAAGTTTYDAGTVIAAVDGCSGSYSYGQSSSISSVASGLAAALASSCSSIVSAAASGSLVSITSKTTGTTTNWPVTTSVTYNSSKFSSASFGAAPSGLAGGKNAVIVYDGGTVVIAVNGYSKSITFGQSDTTSTVAANLVSAINADSSEPVTASASGATVNMTTKQSGSTENISLSASDTYNTTNFSSGSFLGSTSGANLTGGSGSSSTTYYDSGTASLTINGTEETVSYGQGDTTSTVATKLASAFSSDTAISITPSGSALHIAATAAGTSTDYSFSFTTTYNSDFSSPSFSSSPSSGNLAGGTNGSSSPSTIYSYSIAPYSKSSPSSSGYDANGNVISFTDSVMGAWSYQYDSLNRVVGGANASGGPNPRYSDCFGYDNWGNRTNEAYSATACGSSPAPTTWATYSTANRITGTGLMPAGFTYDAAGNVLDDGANEYAYDNEERVCAAQSLTTGIIAGYIYDASGTRVAKGTIASLSCALTGFTLTASYALGPNGEEVSEFNSSNTWQYSNVYAGDKLFATYLNSPSEVDFTLYDWLGTKRVTVHPNGSMATCSSSLAFGNNLTPCGGTGSDPSNLHFTGKERDTESGLDYFGARYLGSSMGRFMSPDSFGGHLEDPQTLNRYSYVGNNPLSRTDPDGHDFYEQCATSDHSGCTQVNTDPKNSKSTQWVQAGKDGNATIITSDSIRSGQNSATVNQNGVQINGSNQGIYFDNAASHSTDANGNDVNHNAIDLSGSGSLNSFNFHIDGNCGGTCLSSGEWNRPGSSADARQTLNANGAFQILGEDAVAGFGGGEHPYSTQYRFNGGTFSCAFSSCPNTPHLSVPFDPASAFPKYGVPAAGGFHVDAHSGYFTHAYDLLTTH